MMAHEETMPAMLKVLVGAPNVMLTSAASSLTVAKGMTIRPEGSKEVTMIIRLMITTTRTTTRLIITSTTTMERLTITEMANSSKKVGSSLMTRMCTFSDGQQCRAMRLWQSMSTGTTNLTL